MEYIGDILGGLGGVRGHEGVNVGERGDRVRWAGLMEVCVGSGCLGGVGVGEEGDGECGAGSSGGAIEYESCGRSV